VLLGELSALATAFCWSGSSISFAEAALRVGSVKVNVTRLILAASLLATTLLAFAIPLNVSKSQLTALFFSGILGLVFGDSFLFKSYEYNGARISSLIMSTAPAVAALLAYVFLNELLSLWAVVGIVVTLIGIALVVTGRQDVSSKFQKITGRGILFAFLGACGQGGGLITAKLAFNEGSINGLLATFIRILSALVFLIPIARFTGHYATPWHIYFTQKKAFGLTFLGAILGPYLGITFSLIAIAHSEVAIAATIMAVVPIIMLPLVKIIYKEVLNWRAYAGAFIAVAGVAILFFV
jgi:drug/metabolite transporter (DMT)-like permease